MIKIIESLPAGASWVGVEGYTLPGEPATVIFALAFASPVVPELPVVPNTVTDTSLAWFIDIPR